MKEEIFSKFKDYNKELEKILEKKDFAKDTKNLLLSMFYKLEISYNDYYIVNRKCKSKQEYLESILNNIKQCNNIRLIKPNDEDFEKFKLENGLYKTDLKLKTIIAFANELVLLSAILELNNFQIYLNEKYNLIRNCFPYILNTAYEMENVEVLRDFNAWSWNTQVNEIKDIVINLIYQNLKIALNLNIFDKIEKEYNDVVETIEKQLLKEYNEDCVKKFIEIIFKISIQIYIKISENEKKRLSEEKENLKIELEEIKNKKLYIERITNQKKQLNEQLKNIDLTLNNKDLLLQEYERRNSTLSEYNKFFSVSHLAERLQKERKKTLEKIELCNKKIEPKKYIENKNKLQKDYNMLKDIKFDTENDIYKNIEKLQEIFLKDIFIKKIENVKEKNDIVDCIYELRYYIFLPYTNEKFIKDISEFKLYIELLKEKIIKKLYANKLINTISTNEKNDIEIIKNIFELRIINIENIYIELKRKNEEYEIIIYDEKETIEKQIKTSLEFNKKDKIKLNKKIKLFV